MSTSEESTGTPPPHASPAAVPAAADISPAQAPDANESLGLDAASLSPPLPLNPTSEASAAPIPAFGQGAAAGEIEPPLATIGASLPACGSPVSESRAADAMPPDLRNEIVELERWALNNQADARRDAFAFWALKIPAMVTAAFAGSFAYFNLQAVGLLTGAVATLFILIDGVLPRGALRNTHLRAFHDIRLLNAKLVSAWRTRSPFSRPENVARRVIKLAEAEKQRIGAYIRDAETALKPSAEEQRN